MSLNAEISEECIIPRETKQETEPSHKVGR